MKFNRQTARYFILSLASAVATIAAQQKTNDPPARLVRYYVEGHKLMTADLTYNDERGEIQQKTVSLPHQFSQWFHAGDTISIMAQKNQDVACDPLYIQCRPMPLGPIKVRVVVNGSTAFSAESNKPFGIAHAKGTLK